MMIEALLKVDCIGELAKHLLVASVCSKIPMSPADCFKLAEDFYAEGQASGRIEIKPASKE